MRLPLTSAILLLVALPGLALASQAGDPLTAVKRSGPVELDGRLDEPAWRDAPAFDGFVQNFPNQGAAPSEATEVRVVYDDRNLYVGLVASDREPDRILRPLGRRDSAPYSDAFVIMVDPMRDGRLGYAFEITAAGVLSDALVFDNDNSSMSWDAVWEGQVASLPDGWSAEVRIPLSAMRFTDAPVQTWGFAIKRTIGRSHEEAMTCLIPRGTRNEIARLGPLTGLAGMEPVPDLQITPYLAGRFVLRPQDPDNDWQPNAPRLADPVAEFGFDLRGSLGRSMALQATVNPDFGQVEADQIIQNLSTFEAFFPEKRPFFLQDMDLFEPVRLGQGHDSPQQLFYSRRIGLDAPILGAAKLTGRVGEDVQIGVLESIVIGDGWPAGASVESPPRDLGFSWSQPFRVGPASALPEQKPASRNFLVGVGKWQPVPTRTVGVTVASALPLDGLCTLQDLERAEEQDVPLPANCTTRAGNAAALDFTLRSPGKEWFVMGQATGSQVQGGRPSGSYVVDVEGQPPEEVTVRGRTLADGTVLERGDTGYGGFLAAGRSGGRGLRGEVNLTLASPRLDVNATGFQRTQNELFGRTFLSWVEPEGGGPFHFWMTQVGSELAYTTDPRGLDRWGQFWWFVEAQTRSFNWMGCVVASDLEAWDVREISQTGDAMRRPRRDWGNCWFDTDGSKPVQFRVDASLGRSAEAGPLEPLWSWAVGSSVRLRPHPRLETRLALTYEQNGWRARYVDTAEGTAYDGQRVFADLDAPLVSVTFRQLVVITPRLTLQAYAQLFTSYGTYDGYKVGPLGDTRIDFGDLAPVTGGPAAIGVSQPDFRDVGLNVNVVTRWEYRPGSTLFLVYTRSQRELAPGGEPEATLRPQRLAGGPAVDTFLVKWTYFWNG